ncbi:hypothetical protein [Streptomyces sp. NPDC091215]|uniref:hypothetical protein n=1 Tax=Streptomyces sp. NPDC091215 TaxID=3155192 RepID=UPI003425320B
MTTPDRPLDLDTILARATHERLTPGPWRLERESCDCGGDYPCGHGMYVTGVVTPTPTYFAAERCKRSGEQPRDYDFHRIDIGDFTDADWELMAHAREDVPALAAEIRRLRARVTELERPAVEAKRAEIRQSFVELSAQCEQDRDYEGAFNVQCQLREREEQWGAEDAANCPGFEKEYQGVSDAKRRLANCKHCGQPRAKHPVAAALVEA